MTTEFIYVYTVSEKRLPLCFE